MTLAGCASATAQRDDADNRTALAADRYKCPTGCGTIINIEADHGSARTCQVCGHEVETGELSEILDTEFVRPEEYRQMSCALYRFIYLSGPPTYRGSSRIRSATFYREFDPDEL